MLPATLLILLTEALRPLSPPFLASLTLVQALCLSADASEAPTALLGLARRLLPPPPVLEARGALAATALAGVVGQLARVLHRASAAVADGEQLGPALAHHAAVAGLPPAAGLALVRQDQLTLEGPAALAVVDEALGQALAALEGLVPRAPRLRPPLGGTSGTFEVQPSGGGL